MDKAAETLFMFPVNHVLRISARYNVLSFVGWRTTHCHLVPASKINDYIYILFIT